MITVYGMDGNAARIGQVTGNLVIELVERANDSTIGHCQHVGTVVAVIVDVRQITMNKTPVFIEAHPVDSEALRVVQRAVDA